MGDIEIDKRYYNRIKNMVVNPIVELFLILPEKAFREFNFDRFVYIKHKDLQGYFFVEKIQNYKNGNVLVRVDTLCVDGFGSLPDAETIPVGDSLILMEDSGYVLQEDGSFILIE